MWSGHFMANPASKSLMAVILVASAALMLASCGIEAAAEQSEVKSPAEQIAERFTEPTPKPITNTERQAQADAAPPKPDTTAKTTEDAKRAAAAKRAEEKSRKAVAAAAAAKARELALEQAKADEAEMLTQARAEAEQRRAEIETARIEREKTEAVEQAKVEQIKVAAEAETRRLAEERKATEQAAIAAAARAAAAQKHVEELKLAEERRLAEQKLLADAKKQAEDRERAADEQRLAEMKALEAKREAEAKILAERLRAAEAAREAKAASAVEPATPIQPVALPAMSPPAVAPLPKSPIPAEASAESRSSNQTMTILIIMEPGTKGIRRFEKSADPVLCMRSGCYISAGASSPARFLSTHKALGAGGTLGDRAGACKHSLGCVFRDVDLASSAGYVQPVDMKVLVHDRRESQTITADSDCRIATAGRLTCRRPLTNSGYRMWVVPEALANRAGAAALEGAVRDGLSSSENAGLIR
jgi:hypothetical protein